MVIDKQLAVICVLYVKRAGRHTCTHARARTEKGSREAGCVVNMPLPEAGPLLVDVKMILQ
jgi:hypothetical protein